MNIYCAKVEKGNGVTSPIDIYARSWFHLCNGFYLVTEKNIKLCIRIHINLTVQDVTLIK